MSAAREEGRFNLSAWALRHQALVVYLIVLATVAGILAYTRLAQSEDPPFTFRVMVIRTFWPGATARQVQEQVTDRIGRKLQETPAIDFLRSYSRPGESLIFFTMKDSAPVKDVPETWYQIRKKVGDIGYTLPPGVQGPFFNDEFGDVYTNIWTLEGDGFSPAQLHDYADQLRTVLLRVPGVAKVDYFGDPAQRIFIEVDNAKLTRLGISPQQLGQAINAQNDVSSAGVLTTTDDRVFVRPSGQFDNVAAIADTPIRINGRTFRLGDLATVRRGYDDPAVTQMRTAASGTGAGKPVLGIGVTMQPGGDVIRLGKALDAQSKALQAQLPAGLKLTEVSSMPHAVSHSVDDFLEAVAEAVAIVLIVSLVSLGLRTGMVVVISIPVVLAVTALFMYLFDIGLHKVSLGTLVLALGLLVDDAIIAVEMMAVKLEQGYNRARAAAFAYTSTAFPMLTGTLVTVSGFLPIALAKSSTGEYTRSIFEVSAIALIASWFAAVVLIPLLGYHLLPERKKHAHDAHLPDDHEHEIYDTRFYRRLRGWIDWCIERRFVVLAITVALFVVSLLGFSLVPQQFFPSSDRPELLVDLRLPEGASFAATLRETERVEQAIAKRPEIDHWVNFVGSGAPRFYLPLDQQLQLPNFAQFVITAKSVEDREKLASWLETTLRDRFPAVRWRLSRLENGPPVGYPVQFRVSGDDIATVRSIADKVAATMRGDARTVNVQFDWDEPAERSVRFELDQKKARELNVTSQDVSSFLAMTLSGTTVTQYRERDKLIAVDLRAAQPDRVDPARLAGLAMPTPNGAVPLGSLGRFTPTLEYGVIWERDRQPTITVQSDVRAGAQGIDVTHAIDGKLNALRAQLPVGYRVEIGGSVEESAKAQASINAQMPLMAIAVFTLLMIQLQSFSRVLMVVLTAPLGLIGVVGTLLLFGQPFGFVAMLGVIAMFGIIMRNSVILVDQIEQDIAAGHGRFDAIVGATVRRFRPITLTAAAAVLALIPLLRSNFFGPMATALMGGITSATVLTLFYLPALYATWFRVKRDERDPQDGPSHGASSGA
ncbi:efflux RND transporter permease subunit [Burkholderia multivorans]|uniref:efflux RND transporter permease subunit n=1 Tax=Burkholderia multivorans TaxID=87883 RepID=UPI000277C4D6|nr:efflux RND transporter permease subunit [Burkholderia multivorans]AJY19323.1 acrB/AcrD/AcrF family protein [Burkholderia multivorans ATCC BAA-247]AVR22184.1 AcrB/AcrD/AcrF family protein [Burkholderia multivorans]EJO63505.1 RND transporter, Hydrophobe/Amphiphile Efflux-1 (HAE1)/Heavy Metal Efflux (HME) family, permease protein [Burkholderia multivorans ATCC BAA-247]MBU9493833.1 efflux RND transporter permease subunit [Burkholderia multivorans]MCO1435606.1 efflux RND transporter permease sub